MIARLPRFSCLVSISVCSLALGFALTANAVNAVIDNPEWEIAISEFGYSDLLFDNRPGFQNIDGDGREYLSGEWGAAVGYTLNGTTFSPKWIEPEFIFPDWQTNSDFGITQMHTFTGNNADNFPIFETKVANSNIEVTQTFQMLDSVSGTPQGTSPASAGGAGSNLASSRYVFKQTYTIQNISGQSVTDLNLFQFLHGFQSENAVYDDRSYNGVFQDYQHDITQRGVSRTLHDLDVGTDGIIVLTQDPNPIVDAISNALQIDFPDFVTIAEPLLDADAATVRAAILAIDPRIEDLINQNFELGVQIDFIVQAIVDADAIFEHDDIISFHSKQAPEGYEVGAYGIEGIDSHLDDGGKPGSGVHLSVEADALGNIDSYFPDALWVSGAQKFALTDLADGESTSFDVLLSIRTQTMAIPIPAVGWLFISGLLAFGGSASWRRRA